MEKKSMYKKNHLQYLSAILVFSLTACGGGGGNEKDVTAPVVTLNGDNPTTVNQGSSYTESGAAVSDNVDSGLTATITGTVDASTVGEYILSYSAIDSAGNEATVVTRTVNVVDTTAPTISSTTPEASATLVARNSIITAVFDEDIFAQTVDSSSFTLAKSSSVDGMVTFDGVTNVATFSPSSELAILANYTVTLSTAITDLSGNALTTDYNWSFTTAEGAWGTAAVVETDNATGHSAFSPQIGFDASGNAIAVWAQGNGTVNRIWANRYDASIGSWSTPELIETNIATGHNAVSPKIGVDDSGNAIAIWIHNDGMLDRIWASRYDVTTGLWSAESMIDADNGDTAFDPQIALDASGNAIVVWDQSESIWANRYDVITGLWSTAAEIETDNTAGHSAYSSQIRFDAIGNAIAVWAQYDGVVDSIWANRYDATAGLWGTEVLIETDNTAGHSASVPQIALDASGNAIAVWEQSDGSVVSIWANRYDTTTGLWSTAELIETDNAAGHNGSVPQIALDASGNAIAVWEQSNGSVDSIWANRYDTTTGLWSEATVIETDNDTGHNGSEPQIALDASGNAIAVWRQSNGSVVSIWANRYDTTTGLWSEATVIETDNDTGHNGSEPQIALDASGNAIAVWSQSDGAVNSIWANHFK